MMRRNTVRTVSVSCVIVLATLTACSQASREELTFDEYVTSFAYDYEPAPSLVALAERSAVVTEATLVAVEEGAVYGNQPADSAMVHLNLVFESPTGNRYYVQLPRSPEVPFDETAAVFPIGATNVIFLQPNDDPLENWSNYREDGNEWFFTTPQGWIIDFPGRGVIHPLEPEASFGIPDPASPEALSSWLPAGLVKDPGMTGRTPRPATIADAERAQASLGTS